MRVIVAMAPLLSFVCGCASAGAGAGDTPVPVYLRTSDVPCAYEAMGRVGGFVMVTSVRQYVAERDRVLGREGARAGADAVLIPATQREPDRDNVGLQFRSVGGVTQTSELRVSGDAIRFVSDGCGPR
jgi:hypothetical protein